MDAKHFLLLLNAIIVTESLITGFCMTAEDDVPDFHELDADIERQFHELSALNDAIFIGWAFFSPPPTKVKQDAMREWTEYNLIRHNWTRTSIRLILWNWRQIYWTHSEYGQSLTINTFKAFDWLIKRKNFKNWPIEECFKAFVHWKKILNFNTYLNNNWIIFLIKCITHSFLLL